MAEGDIIVKVKYVVKQEKFGDIATDINKWNGIVEDMQVEK